MPAQSSGLKMEVFESEHPTVVDFLREQPSHSHTELQSLRTALYKDNRSFLKAHEPFCGFTFVLYFTYIFSYVVATLCSVLLVHLLRRMITKLTCELVKPFSLFLSVSFALSAAR